MADYIETVPQEVFDMSNIRGSIYDTGFNLTPECNTVGCIIGHCTILAPELIKHYPLTKSIKFIKWSEDFTGLTHFPYHKEWEWLFEASWGTIDNTPTGAAKRIRHFVEHGLPDDWEQIMNGEKPLPYEKHS